MDSSEYQQKIKEMKQETKRLKQWIIDHGQPAIEKVDELQMMLEVYETERTDKQYELQSFQTRLSKMENLEQALHQTQSTSTLLLQENDSLLLSVHESAKKSEIERKKYNEAIREAAEYKKLSKELQEINDKYNKKNQLLNEKQVSLEEENQNLRQLLLQYETEQTQYIEEYNQEIEVIKNEMKNLQNDLETKNDPHKNVKWYISDDDNYNSNGYDSSNGDRKRRMTLRNDENDRHTDNELNARDMASEIDNSLTGRGIMNGGGNGGGGQRNRRHTIKMWYQAHVRKASHITLPNEEELNNLHNNGAYVTDPEEAVPTITFASRQDSTHSNISTTSGQQQQHPQLWNTKSYEDPALIMMPPNRMSPLQNGHKQDSAPLLRDGGLGGSMNQLFPKDHADIFEDAVAQEIKIELRKQIEKELNDDYQLKMQQRDIEYKMKLNKEQHEINERERKLKEEYEKQINELQARLTEYSKGNGTNNLRVDDMNFDNDEMVLLGGDGGMTNLSSPISDYDIGSEEEKDVFDSDMIEDEETDDQYINNNNNNNDRPQMMNRAQMNDDRDIERQPLIEKDKKSFNDEYVDKVLSNRDGKKHKKNKKKKRKARVGETVPEEDLTAIPNPNSDDKCFSCFGLFGGGGV